MFATVSRSLTLTLLVVAIGVAAEPAIPSLSDAEKEEGFELLFNGRDLDGWEEVQGIAGSFVVRDGELLGHRHRGKLTAYWLSTKEQYGDFVLRLEYLLQPRGNSGVFIRVPHHRPRTSVVGMEIQLLDDGKQEGTPNAGSTGSVYRAKASTAFAARPANEWNELEIECRGDNIRVTLNGVPVNDVDMSQVESLRHRPRKGYIGLSAHTDEVRFRNVRIKPLDEPETKAAAAGSED